jgi:hypothetical protein
MNDKERLHYVYAVCTETVYNQVFGLLPIWPYSWRRRVARRIANYLNVREMPLPPSPLATAKLTVDQSEFDAGMERTKDALRSLSRSPATPGEEGR